ncbi:MAG: type II toxin-antitoxin system Phd/YefM family antitoxin [Ignavibacterium sp.]|nr:type II toxin-antitoxin system Phd/YefM family antitoxin [Ignavibacteriaceae bacterium]MDD5606994.1 type II toxin-antitoxin system Phd/YefM family antitoxin [Ignavibacterium sp.]MDX9712381.1 type II toxin-antitoxin system Phd/YefM family antitoxin [Ignavibacteriaceae bacterium]
MDKVIKSKRPLVITQNGKSAAILLSVSEYENMVEKIEVLEEIKLAKLQIKEELKVNHSTVKVRRAK